MDERRKTSPRIKIDVKSTFQYSGAASAKIVNISSGGIFIRTDSPPPIDSTLSLHFHLPNDPEPLYVEGRAVWIKQSNNALPPGLGVQFDNISLLHKKRIQSFVESFMINQADRAVHAVA